MSGNVAKLVNRLSKDLTINKTSSSCINFRQSGVMSPRIATVRFSYKRTHEDELDLTVDDQIEVLEEAESGWMKGKLQSNGCVGLFPTNFVQFNDSNNATGTSDVSKSNNMKTKNVDSPTSIGCGDCSPEATARISVIEVSKNRATSSTSCRKAAGDTDYSEAVSKARVLFTYTPSHDDELALTEVGQLINIVSKSVDDPGWLLAEIDGKRGLIPDNFVEILRLTTTSNFAATDIHKMQTPPVPIKPPKIPGLSSLNNRRTVNSSAFAAMHSTLADAFTKPPKSFQNKNAQYDEPSTEEGRAENRLSHLTTSRPKQSNKRPPSAIYIRKDSNDDIPSAENELPVAEEDTDDAVVNTVSTLFIPVQSTTVAPSQKAAKTQLSPLLSSKSSSGITNENDHHYVTRKEYDKLLLQMDNMRVELNDLRAELAQKIAEIEAKVPKQGQD